MAPDTMDELADIRRQRDLRRLNCAIYQADLHATGEQSLHLRAVKHAARAGHMSISDAIQTVNRLRGEQQAA